MRRNLEYLQRTNQTDRKSAEMEPEGEVEFGSRFKDTAGTPNLWNLIEVARDRVSRSYCFWKLLCNLVADLVWVCVRWRRRL